MFMILYLFGCIYVPAHQAGPKTIQNYYDNTLTGLYRIERNVCSVCRHIELLKIDYSLTGM